MDCGSLRGVADEVECGISAFVNWETRICYDLFIKNDVQGALLVICAFVFTKVGF